MLFFRDHLLGEAGAKTRLPCAFALSMAWSKRPVNRSRESALDRNVHLHMLFLDGVYIAHHGKPLGSASSRKPAWRCPR